MTEAAAKRLEQRAPLALDPDGAIAIKRDVHELEIDVDAESFAEAFRAVMTDPGGTFGLIRVRRPAGRMGRAFEVGERFQGCFSVELAVAGWRGLGPARRALTALLDTPAGQRAVDWIEDQFLSDYAQIEELTLEPGAGYRLRYRYLEGTPIAGSSVFLVEPLGERRCRVTQIFEYQEQSGIALATFQRMGLKMHDQVVHQQIARAAARAGGRVVHATIPAAYAEAA